MLEDDDRRNEQEEHERGRRDLLDGSRPSVAVGGDRGTDYSIEFGYKTIRF